MSSQTRATNKTNFETGDTPGELEFIDLIDSLVSIEDDGQGRWFRTTHSYTELNGTGATSETVTSGDLPSGFFPVAFAARTTVSWATSGGITGMEVAAYDPVIGAVTSGNKYLPMTADPDVWTFGRVDDNLTQSYGAGYAFDLSVPLTAYVYVEATGDLLNTLTAGEFEFWILARRMPSNPTVIFP